MSETPFQLDKNERLSVMSMVLGRGRDKCPEVKAIVVEFEEIVKAIENIRMVPAE